MSFSAHGHAYRPMLGVGVDTVSIGGLHVVIGLVEPDIDVRDGMPLADDKRVRLLRNNKKRLSAILDWAEECRNLYERTLVMRSIHCCSILPMQAYLQVDLGNVGESLQCRVWMRALRLACSPSPEALRRTYGTSLLSVRMAAY